MKNVILGKTGLPVSYMGFGGIPIQRTSQQEVTNLVHHMKELGVNYIDSARGYTVSEEYLGQALLGIRDSFVLATKSMARTKSDMARDIRTSLRNFQTDTIDLYQVHNPSLSDLETVCGPDGALEALMEAKEKGHIGHLGITAHSTAVFEKALTLPWVETIMFPYNIVETQAEELITQCHEQGIGFIAMKPLAGGAITDTDLALRFIHQNPNVTVMIPGIYSGKELEQNLSAIEKTGPFSSDEVKQLQQIRDTLGTNFCRRCNYCQPCSAGISISSCFLFQGYLERYGLKDWAMERYNAMKVKASACIHCGKCETRCPYELPIQQMLKKCVEEFEE